MNPSALEPCVTTVPSLPGGSPAQALPLTGADLSLLPWAVVVGVLLLVAGAIALTRRRKRGLPTAAAAAALILLALGAPAVNGPAPSSYAATTQQCSLFSLGDVQRGDPQSAGRLLPGQRADVLSFTTTNVTSRPLTLTVALTPTGGEPSAFLADIMSNSLVVASGLISDSPTTTSISLAPGQSLDLGVTVGLAPSFDRSGTTATFDAVVTAIGS